MSPRQKLFIWLPVILWATMIFCLSSLSFETSPEMPGFLERYRLDKPVHLVLFGTLSWLLLQATRRGGTLRLPAAAVLAIFVTSAYGASDEWHQTFVPGRYASVADWAADTAGAVIAAIIYRRYESRPS